MKILKLSYICIAFIFLSNCAGEPLLFKFASINDVIPNAYVYSDEVKVFNISDDSEIEIENGEYSINGSEFTSNKGLIDNDDILQLRQISQLEGETVTKFNVDKDYGEFKTNVIENYINSRPTINYIEWNNSISRYDRSEYDFKKISNTADNIIYRNILDIDQDNDKDILVASKDDHTIAWYSNDGNEEYQFNIIDQRAYDVRDIDIADLDNDGDLDVVSALSKENSVYWYENIGNEKFSKHILSDMEIDVFEIEIIDIDSDGDNDVVSVSNINSEVVLFENKGEKNYERKVILDSNSIASIFFKDIDQDNDEDLIYIQEYGNFIYIFENIGNGEFKEKKLENDTTILEVRLSDLDNDDDLDIVFISNNAASRFPKISWMENIDKLQFNNKLLLAEINIVEKYLLEVVDIDGDNDKDIMLNSYFLENLGEEIYTRSVCTICLEGTNYTYFGNDPDGYVRFLSGSIGFKNLNYYDRKNYIFEGETKLPFEGASDENILNYQVQKGMHSDLFKIDTLTGSIEFKESVEYYENEINKYFITVLVDDGFILTKVRLLIIVIPNDEDDDNDGVIDLIDAFPNNASYKYDGNNNGIGDRSEDDLDNDGVNNYNDNAPYDSDSNQVPKWINESIENIPLVVAEETGEVIKFEVLDFDFDGDEDIVAISAYRVDIVDNSLSFLNNSITLYENIDNKFFEENVIDSEIGIVLSIDIIDLDKDGDLDVLSVSPQHNSIFWYENIGNNNFSKNIVLEGIKDPLTVISVDFDNDEDIDILTASYSQDELILLSNMGNQNFEKTVINSSIPFVRTLGVGDLDGDGDQDVITASYNEEKRDRTRTGVIHWFENVESGEYIRHGISFISDFSRVHKIITEDINNDGQLDIKLKHNGNVNLSIINKGGKPFAFSQTNLSFGEDNGYEINDVDIDGDLDFDRFYFEGWGENLNHYKKMYFNHVFDSTNSIREYWLYYGEDYEYWALPYQANGETNIFTTLAEERTILSHDLIQSKYQITESEIHIGVEQAIDEDGNTLTYNMVGGSDHELININSETGELSFKSAPSYSNPEDLNEDNNYIFTISVSDGYSSITRRVSVDVLESL
ncbi:FG-GAP-like repeat-containing protein [Marinicellulosiphila megalodicopiae]|uniref:FG-GAP-like repeat-containing protein n=1 Tax=Marinicellulosiphila megalodicopiae TaxID=2724896 RepID=UPI003BB1545F